MSLSQFLSTLRARWKVAVLMLMLTVGTAIAVSFLSTKQYTATSSLVIDAKPDPVVPMSYQVMMSPAYMATQVDVIRSDRVAQRVVRSLKLTESPEVRKQWMEATQGEGNIEVWLSKSLQVLLDVQPSRESNVISVAFKASDPEFAASLANAFVQAYLDVSVELRVDPAKQYSAFFESRAKELRANVERAQAKLSAYQREKGIIATDERLDVETMRLNELSSQLTALQVITSESSSRQAQAQGASSDRLHEVVNNPLLGALRSDLGRAEARLQELNSRLGDNHPQVVEAKANINSLRSKLGSETSRVTGSVSVTNTINRQREAEIRASLEAQRAKLLRMKVMRDEGAVMYRDVENAQRAYDAVLARLNQTSLESQTTQSNVYVLTQALAPMLPSSPKVARNIALSIVIGLMLAAGAVFLLELVDRRIRSVDEVTELIGLPIIGVLPKPGRKGGFVGRRKPLVMPRLLGPLPTANRES